MSYFPEVYTRMNNGWNGPATYSKTATPSRRTEQYGNSYEQFRTRPCENRGTYSHFYKKIQNNVRCFNCKTLGHFAKTCPYQRRSFEKPNISKPVTKSQKKKDRDSKRMQQFIDRKSVCVIMPFYESSEQELISFMPKWHNQFVNKDTKAVFEDTVVTLRYEAEVLRSENTKLSAAIKKNAGKVHLLETEILDNKYKIGVLKANNKEQLIENNKLQSRVKELNEMMDTLKKDLESKETKLKMAVKVQETQKQHIERLSARYSNNHRDPQAENARQTHHRDRRRNEQDRQGRNGDRHWGPRY